MSEQIKIIRLPVVSEMTGLPRATIYDHMAKGTFPKQVKIGPRAAGWVSADVEAWIQSRIAESRLRMRVA
ncbi:AlpA family transcriptional regulator [Lysobacter niastensis]|uniref:helix-turn-helix transcriptional regulator n=1 Tax=Lysobacter niastensis TaxID=380629 RepID=UPI002B4B07D8|nr:AlpA family transcriptional regulator [Lysobacter niastensis]